MIQNQTKTMKTVANNGILLPKLFWPSARKKCSSDREKLLKLEAEGREFAKILRSLEQFIQTVKGHNIFWKCIKGSLLTSVHCLNKSF